LSGVGPIIARSVVEFFKDKTNKKIVDSLLKQVKIKTEKETLSSKLSGLRFVVTGTMEKYSRDEMKDLIRKNGGTVSESVSKDTTYLVAGDNAGSKYEKAEEYGVKILTEKEFLALL
jgi:DNA ligase (NAD+)